MLFCLILTTGICIIFLSVLIAESIVLTPFDKYNNMTSAKDLS